MRTVHLIGVPLDLGGGRRGVDMGPSAFRIAGLSERPRRSAARSSTRATWRCPSRRRRRRGAGPQATLHPRDRRGLPAPVSDSSSRPFDEGALPLARGRPLSGGRVGGGVRGLCAAHGQASDRPAVGRRARRHEHPRSDVVERQRARHAARGAARARAGGVVGWHRPAFAQGPRGEDGPRRRPQPRRPREGSRSRGGSTSSR